MTLLLGMALLWFSVRLMFAAETSTCKYNEYTIESESGNLTCLACRKCQAGFGLFPQCGTEIKDNETRNECKACQLGKTYSAHDDISSCEPCDTCSNHQTIAKNCTLYSDSQCKDICAKGFYFENLTWDCQPCTWCCPDGNIKVKSGCKEMPLYKQCDVNTAKKCKPKCQDDQYVVPGSKGGGHCQDCKACPPGTSPFPECGSVVENINSISCRQAKGFKHSHLKGWWAGIPVGGIMVIALAVFCVWRKFCKSGTDESSSLLIHEGNGNSGATAEQQRSQSGAAGNSGDTMTIQTFAKTSVGEGSSGNNSSSDTHEQNGACGNSGATAEQQRSQSGAAGNSGDTMTIQTFAKTSVGEGSSGNNNSRDTHEQNGACVSKPLKDLVNDPSDYLSEICKRLDTPLPGVGNYEKVAKYYNFDVYTIYDFKVCREGPSNALISAIMARYPKVTVEMFAIVVVEQASRGDVAELLRAFDRK